MIIYGACNILFPSELVISHPSFGWHVYFPQWTEHISKGGARVYGALAWSMGGGLIWLVLYRGRK